MNRIKRIISKISSPIWVGILVLLTTIIVIVISSTVLYNRTVDLLTQNFRERILTISITASANIDPSDLDALQVESDWQKPEWARVVNRLHKAKYTVRLHKPAEMPSVTFLFLKYQSVKIFRNTKVRLQPVPVPKTQSRVFLFYSSIIYRR